MEAIRHDTQGGVIVIYDDIGGRQLIWLNENGHVITNQVLSNDTFIASVFKDRIYLFGDVAPDPSGVSPFVQAVRIIYRNGTTDLAAGSYGLSASEIGDYQPWVSDTFTSDGFYSYEYFQLPEDPDRYIPKIVYYRAKKN